jgi:hypothetical protein
MSIKHKLSRIDVLVWRRAGRFDMSDVLSVAAFNFSKDFVPAAIKMRWRLPGARDPVLKPS